MILLRTRARLGCLLALSLAGALGHAPAASAQRSNHDTTPTASPDDSARALHLLGRATFGVRPQDLDRLLRIGEKQWLDEQLHPDRLPGDVERTVVSRHPVVAMTGQEVYEAYPPRQAKASQAKASQAEASQAEASQAEASQAKAEAARAGAAGRAMSPQALLAELGHARLERAVGSDRQLEEMMTEFWFNHFNVFFQKGADRYLVADYEARAIRPNVFGHFEDLLRATAQHPAMLFYLDNWQSVSIDSSLIRRARARGGRGGAPQQLPPRLASRGLNENYARELMELHTLGVDGGYTQQDVVQVARALTGWTFNPPRPNASDGTLEFVFRPQLHDRNAKTVLGHALPAGRGVEDGLDVLHILATSPATARFISHKLVEYFVNDRGDNALEAKLANVFTRTNGDLREVTRTLFSAPEFFAARNRGTKVKTPFELVASALRVTGAQASGPRGVLQILKTLGEVPYMCSPPTGYPASSADWVNSGAMLTRMNFGIDLASGGIPGVRAAQPPDLNGDRADAIAALAHRLLPGRNTERLQRTVLADLAAQSSADVRAESMRAAGLLLGSPEFQHH